MFPASTQKFFKKSLFWSWPVDYCIKHPCTQDLSSSPTGLFRSFTASRELSWLRQWTSNWIYIYIYITQMNWNQWKKEMNEHKWNSKNCIYIYIYREREREREADSCAYLLRSMGICYSSKYSFFILWVFATVANTHWNFEWVFATHNGYLLP